MMVFGPALQYARQAFVALSPLSKVPLAMPVVEACRREHSLFIERLSSGSMRCEVERVRLTTASIHQRQAHDSDHTKLSVADG